ncbi:HGGxSTG domain-containing protein [Lysobacter sp. CFH 32150]|uniref:HGGxSTG domain-containing protein n=1 Tax=Lysobacter sp. CFH 32150 TaxID=2927128 RepID=UPI001FA81149|nr:HGGxSTG domain-containing protein [Lysobacter sp. CFH 32150]MCI4567567.1 hypothetical protein [Lysobacter sp. CFH 32150]
MTRIDYMPSATALAVIAAKRAQQRPGSVAATKSAVIDAIVTEWVELAGIKKLRKKGSSPPELMQPSRPRARANESGVAVPELSDPIRAPAYDFGADLPTWTETWLAANRAKQTSRRVICGARRHRDGQPCRAKSEPGKRRCKWHGGCSTGPRTVDGKTRALANLKQNRQSAD